MALFDLEPLEIQKGLPGQMFDVSCKGCVIEETFFSSQKCPYRSERPLEFSTLEDQICSCCDDHRALCKEAYLD